MNSEVKSDDYTKIIEKTHKESDKAISFKISSLMIFLVLILTSGTQSVNANANSQSIMRHNFGVIFKFVKEFDIITHHWQHTYVLNIPEMQFYNYFLTMQSHELFRQNVTNQLNHNANIAFLNTISHDGLQNLHYLETAIHALLDRYDIPLENGKNKRAILGFLAKPLKSVLGLATEEDLEILQSQVLMVVENQNKQLDILKENTKNLNSFVHMSNTRIDNLVQQVKNNALENIRLVRHGFMQIKEEINFLNNITIHTMHFMHMVDKLEKLYQNFLMGLEIVISGKLSPFLIEKDTLNKTLNDIQKLLINDNNHYRLIHLYDLAFYYRHATFHTLRMQNKLLITINIPISSCTSSYRMYQLIHLPLHGYDNQRGHVVRSTISDKALIIDNDNQYYYTLDSEEYSKTNQYLTRIQNRIFLTVNDKSCILAIFRNIKPLVDTVCKYEIWTNSLNSEIIHVEKTQYYLFNIDKYSLICNGQATNHGGCKSCLIELNNNCSLHTEQYFIPQSRTKQGEKTEQIVHHTTNLALLQKFFDETQLETIHGSSLTLTEPAIIIPQFKYFEDNVTQTFATDDKYKLDLEKTAQSTRDQSMIVRGLSEAIVLGKINPPNNFWSNFESLLLIICSILIAILIINTGILWWKLQVITVSIATLNTRIQMPAAAEIQDKLFLDFFLTTINPNATDKRQININQTIIQVSEKHMPYVLIAIILTVLCVVIIRKTIKKLSVNCKFNNHCHILLEFTVKTKAISCSLIKLEATPNNYQIIATNALNQVNIAGIFKPTLQHNWKIIIHNTLSNQQTILPEEIRIPIVTAYLIKNILKKEHSCMALWFYHKQKFKLHVKTQPTSDAVTSESNDQIGQPQNEYPALNDNEI